MIELIFFFFIFQIINIENIIGASFVVAGFPIWTWVIYLFYLMSYGSVLLYLLEGNDRKGMLNCTFFFAFSVLCVHIVSVVYGASITTILRESYHYVLPIFMYPVLCRCKYRFASFWKFVKFLIGVNLIISVGFVTGLLGTLTNTSYISMLSRSSTLIDGGLGIVSLSIGLYCLFYDNDIYSKKESWFFIIAGVIITLSGQSRARLLTAILIVILFYFMSVVGKNRNSGKRFSWLSAILLFSIVGICISIFLSENENSLISQIFDRFSLIGTDNSSIYRVYERETQLSIFKAHPIFGGGWGAYDNVSVQDIYGVAKDVNNHNMFTSILGFGGVILGLAYISWFVKIMKGTIRRFSTNSIERLNIILLVSILVLSYSSAGFGKSSMILAITIIYVNMIHYDNRGTRKGWNSLK